MLELAGPVRGSSIFMVALLKTVSLLANLVAMVVGSVRRPSGNNGGLVPELCWLGVGRKRSHGLQGVWHIRRDLRCSQGHLGRTYPCSVSSELHSLTW